LNSTYHQTIRASEWGQTMIHLLKHEDSEEAKQSGSDQSEISRREFITGQFGDS
jgi:hypothetical protein